MDKHAAIAKLPSLSPASSITADDDEGGGVAVDDGGDDDDGDDEEDDIATTYKRIMSCNRYRSCSESKLRNDCLQRHIKPSSTLFRPMD